MSKINCYKFTFHHRVPDDPPENDITRLLDKAFGDEDLTREEKDRIANILYGMGSRQSYSYHLSGWRWPMKEAKQMRRILVKRPHYGWNEFYAPDKTSLRKVLSPKPIEMIYIEK